MEHKLEQTAETVPTVQTEPKVDIGLKIQIDMADLRSMLLRFAALVREQHPMLTDLDCAAGDGDHGTTMLRGAERIEAVLAKDAEASPTATGVPQHTVPDGSMQALLDAVGWEYIGLDGGASGPLVGTIFVGMGAACEGRTVLDTPALAAVFEGGLAALQRKTKAQRGDKTLLDSLIPAVEAVRASAARDEDVAHALKAGAAAAQAGALETKNLIAGFGRAKNLGERTRGHQDPGATSLALLFTAFSESVSERKEVKHGRHG